ncbi:MAG: cellulase family glycosylhydrolase [Solirubrobacteraceae bacterium]
MEVRTRLTVLSLLVLLVLPATAAARPSQFTMFEAPRELLSDDAAVRAQTFDEIRGFGVHWLRVVLYWHSVAPSPDSAYKPAFDERDPNAYPGFGRYDRLLAEAKARGMRVLLTVSGPVPRWATARRFDTVTRPSPTRFERFMTAVGRRYGAQITHWAIWNEPNHPDFLRPQYSGHKTPVSPGIYRRLVQAADRGLRASGHARDRMIIGETAPRGTGKDVAPLTFLRGAACLTSSYHLRKGCHRLPGDAWAMHAYTPAAGPFFVPPSRNDVTIGVLGRLNSALARAGRAHALRTGMPIYLTEFGIQSYPDKLSGVSQTQQAEYRSISERIATHNARVYGFSQYLMRDDQPGPGTGLARYGGFESGLRLADGSRKLAYEAFRLPLVAARGHTRTTLWGLVRPAHGRTRVSIDYRNRGSSTWRDLKRDTTGTTGYWTTTTSARSGRAYRVRWTAPDGTRYTGPLTRSYRGR